MVKVLSEKDISDIENIKKSGSIPEHIAIIMDGNGRWAKSKSLPRAAGHKQGVETVRIMVQAAIMWQTMPLLKDLFFSIICV